jgi:hypothetical protein
MVMDKLENRFLINNWFGYIMSIRITNQNQKPAKWWLPISAWYAAQKATFYD